jgi:hypothetical protein
MVDVVEAGFVSAVDVSEFQKFVSNTPLTDEEERIWVYVDDLQKMMQQQMQDHQEESQGVRGGDYGVHETSPVSDIPLFLGILLSAFVVLLCLSKTNKPHSFKTVFLKRSREKYKTNNYKDSRVRSQKAQFG